MNLQLIPLIRAARGYRNALTYRGAARNDTEARERLAAVIHYRERLQDLVITESVWSALSDLPDDALIQMSVVE